MAFFQCMTTVCCPCLPKAGGCLPPAYRLSNTLYTHSITSHLDCLMLYSNALSQLWLCKSVTHWCRHVPSSYVSPSPSTSTATQTCPLSELLIHTHNGQRRLSGWSSAAHQRARARGDARGACGFCRRRATFVHAEPHRVALDTCYEMSRRV